MLDHRLLVNPPGGGVVTVKGSNALLAGEKIVASIAAPETLASTTAVAAVTIQAKRDNIASVYLGSVAAQYVELAPGQSISIGVNDLALIYVAVDSDADGVNYLAVT